MVLLNCRSDIPVHAYVILHFWLLERPTHPVPIGSVATRNSEDNSRVTIAKQITVEFLLPLQDLYAFALAPLYAMHGIPSPLILSQLRRPHGMLAMWQARELRTPNTFRLSRPRFCVMTLHS